MKKLSIVLALIMALSCFGLTAFAAEGDTAEAAAPAKVVIGVNFFAVDGTLTETKTLNYEAAPGTTLTAADILAAVKSRLGDEQVDLDEYVLNETVVAYDDVNADGVAADPYKFTSVKVVAGAEYKFDVSAHEIDDVKNLAVTIGEQLAKIDWAGIAKANVALINQLINGGKAAIDSLVNAEWPEADKAEKEETTTVETVETPDTGVSAVAGAAVVVLALSATTAVVLRKKED